MSIGILYEHGISFRYYEWLQEVQTLVEHYVILRINNPGDLIIPHDTDELTCNGYLLKGQNIETSRITGNVFIQADLLTFTYWLKQQKETR